MKKFIIFLEDASEEKLKHLEHAEDHVINSGKKGFVHAFRNLKDTHDMMKGKKKDAKISVKYDGSPSVIFGHHPETGKFFVATKSAFNKNPKLNYSRQDIEDNHGHAPGLVSKLHAALQHLPKITPKKGVFQGDIMHTPEDVHKSDGKVHFKPNTITYSTPEDSHHGQAAVKSKIGVAVHTAYHGSDLENMKAHYAPDLSSTFSAHKDVHLIGVHHDAAASDYGDKDQSKFRQHMAAAVRSHKQTTDAHYNAIQGHETAIKTYINHTVRTGTSPTVSGLKAHVAAAHDKKIASVSSPAAKEKKTAEKDAVMSHFHAHSSGLKNILATHSHLQKAKNVLVDAASSKTDFEHSIGGAKAKPEGFVAVRKNRPTKLVDRQEFSRANFNREATEENHHDVTFGRMNPVTIGHEAVVNQVKKAAKEHGGGHTIILSGSQDAKKNPLTPEQKLKHAKRAFPDTNIKVASKTSPTLLHTASDLHKQGVTHLHVHVGSDRVNEMGALLHKYNGAEGKHGHYNFKKITMHAVGGERKDDGGEGVESASGSVMRKHVKEGDKESFMRKAPSKMSPKHKEEMYNDVRKGMGINESFMIRFKAYK